MRELKFRVWIKDEERYYDESDEESYMIVPNGNVTYTSESYEEDGVWFNDTTSATNDVVVEQYTGLKDKNGKEIYEGDIVRTKSCDQPNFSAGAIEMVQQMYLIMNSAHYRDPEISHCEPLGHYCDTELEVIGNIHKNPELVEEKE